MNVCGILYVKSMYSYVLIRRHFLAGRSCSSLVTTAFNSSIVCATSASSTRLSRVLAAAALADNDSPDTAPRIRRWSRKSWWSFARPDLRFLARRCATILVASTPLNVVAGEGNGLGTTTRGPHPRLGLLGRCPCPDVPEFPCAILLPRLTGGIVFPRARPPPRQPAFCAAHAPYLHLHVHPRALRGAAFIQCMHVARACRNMRKCTRIGVRCCCGRPVGALERPRSLLRRSSMLPSLLLLLLWLLSRSCSRPSQSGLDNSRAVDPPSVLGRRGSFTKSYGGGGVVERSSSDACP